MFEDIELELTVNEIGQLVKGRVKGDGSAVIRGAAGLSEAGESDISFLRDVKSPKGLKAFASSQAAAVFVPTGADHSARTIIEVDNPMAAFAAVLQLLANEKQVRRGGVHPLACVEKSAKVAASATVGPFCVIEDGAVVAEDAWLVSNVYVGARAKVGAGTKIYPHVVLREEVEIGARGVIHGGAVIGSDGFGFYFAGGKHNKIPQIGNVIVEDDVEIGACATIDRATTGSTIIRRGTKIDNLVQVAHNVDVGEHNLLAAQVGIAGSTKLGKGVVLAGQVGVADHATLGDGVQIGAQAGVKDEIPAGAVLWGSPAQPIQDTIRQMLLIRRLPELFKDVKKLKETNDHHA